MAGPSRRFLLAKLVSKILEFRFVNNFPFPSVSIFLTGVLYSRYAMVIVPKNYTLFSCNLFVAISNGIQLGRIFHYRQGLAHQQEEQQEASKITTLMDGTSSVASVLAPVASNAVAAVASTASVAASTSIPKLALNVELWTLKQVQMKNRIKKIDNYKANCSIKFGKWIFIQSNPCLFCVCVSLIEKR